MKYYKDKVGQIWAYDEAEQQHLIEAAEADGMEYLPVFPLPLTDAEKLAQNAVESKAMVMREIAELEASQHRMMREAVLGIDGALERLDLLNAKIRSIANRGAQ